MSARSRFILTILAVASLIAAYSVEAQQMKAPKLHSDWRVEDVSARGIPDGAQITLRFDADGRVSGGAGCNRYFATYAQDGKGLTIGPLGMTRMACVPALMEIEQRFAAALSQVGAAEFDDSGALILTDASGAPLVTARRIQSN